MLKTRTSLVALAFHLLIAAVVIMPQKLMAQGLASAQQATISQLRSRYATPEKSQFETAAEYARRSPGAAQSPFLIPLT